jgi:hypothetical protein
MNRILRLQIAVAVLLLTTTAIPANTKAVSYRGIGDDGTRFFVCEHFCGKVRVKKIGKQLFRVYSIGYSGNIAAGSEKEAAEKACGERDMSGAKRNPAVADRGGACN